MHGRCFYSKTRLRSEYDCGVITEYSVFTPQLRTVQLFGTTGPDKLTSPGDWVRVQVMSEESRDTVSISCVA